MDRTTILHRLAQIIKDVVDNDELIIDDKTIATDVEGWDSLAQVLIVGELQKQLGVKFTSSEIRNLANVGELVNAIMEKLN